MFVLGLAGRSNDLKQASLVIFVGVALLTIPTYATGNAAQNHLQERGEVNAQQPPYSSLKKFRMMDHDFTQESGELTPTLKVKRKLCSQKYKAMLDAMYEGDIAD